MKNKSYWLLLAVVLILVGDNIYVSHLNNKDDERISQLERQLGHEVTKEFEAECKYDSLKEEKDSQTQYIIHLEHLSLKCLGVISEDSSTTIEDNHGNMSIKF